jgi:alpha-beta hydrolase superfamily lysophospholipase
MKRFLHWLWIGGLVYIGLGLLLYFLQDLVIFHPKKLSTDYAYKFDIPFREIYIPVNNNKNLSIVQFTVPDSSRKGIVLYFHGNRENINRYAKYAPMFTKNGYETWMIDYPGYGKSTGRRSEQQLYDDALLMYRMAIKAVPLEQIIIYGKSLGTGIAAQLASVRECKRVILETPYYSMAKLASHFFPIFPVKPFIKYELPTYKYLEYIKAPVTIIHGTKDGLIPYKHARWLAEKKAGVELITIPGGKHNNLADFDVFKIKIDSLLQL